jgi:hypothetical protein
MPQIDLNDRINQVIEGFEEPVDLPDGELAPEDIRIQPPREPEVNPVIYRDVEGLLFRGFLLVSADINREAFVFKSLNHREFETLHWATGGRIDERYYNRFIAHCVFMVAGQNILADRAQWMPELEALFSSMPSSARTKIVRYLSEVNRRAYDAVTMTEAYQMEKVSRFRWAQYRTIDMMSSSTTGVAGSGQLGLNYAQLIWRALNYYDDLREDSERQWDNAKFIGSCFAGKEVRKIYAQDRDRRLKEQDERVRRKDQVIRQVLLGEDPNKPKTDGRYVKFVANTVEELASQLESDLRGERDWHDEVVAREEARMKQEYLDRQERVRELWVEREAQQEQAGRDITRGYTPAEIREMKQRQRQQRAQEASSRVVYPEFQDERMASFYSKYVAREDTPNAPGVEVSVGTTDRDPTHAQPLVVPKDRGTPFRR